MTGAIHVACAADSRYARHCAAMLHSVLVQAGGERIHVHFLHEPTLPAGVLRKLARLVGAGGGEFVPSPVLDTRVSPLHSTADIAQVAWYRSLLPELRPALDRVLYLDCDVIVRESLAPLWETSLDGFFIAAVKNVLEPKLATRHHALEIPASQPYFNSGVMLMNLALMREHGCVEAILAHALRHGPKLIWVDQDSLNHALGARCHFLHPRWNCQNSLYYWPEAHGVFGSDVVKEATGRPAIVHFEGPGFAKPWHYLNTHPLREEYWRHVRATPFRPHVEGITPANVLRRLKDRLRTPLLLRAARRLRRLASRRR